ncbi:hypothetical protein [Anthocerotibacter panamensis]|uniref:hypothetical protein n=1 Tax=Anthocerotibacter panamensis TaxID=2857077 RepID=UPI001C405F56|nr:hypothetical protein [Anthocerotibacter panamensis]
MSRSTDSNRPIYLDSKQMDQLLTIVLALMGEVSVLRNRLDTLERLAEAKEMILREEMESYVPTAQVEQERERWRADYLARVLRALQEDRCTGVPEE